MATFVSCSTRFFFFFVVVAHSRTHSNTDGSELPQKVQEEVGGQTASLPPEPQSAPVSVCVSDIPVLM